MRHNSRDRSARPLPRPVPVSKPSLLYSKRGNGEPWTAALRLAALANLAHELRTPLQVLLGYLDALKHQLPKKLPMQSRQMLERMNANACELTRIVENITEFALDDARTATNEGTQVPTRKLLDEVMPLIESTIQEKGLALHLDLEAAPAVIYARHRQLRLILANLVVDAIRSTAAGSVTIAIRRAGKPERPEVALEVSDTSAGSGPELREKLSAPFARLSSSNSHRDHGLGLTVVKRCVAALNGNLEVHSAPGQGSRFLVRFPIPAHGAASAPLVRN